MLGYIKFISKVYFSLLFICCNIIHCQKKVDSTTVKTEYFKEFIVNSKNFDSIEKLLSREYQINSQRSKDLYLTYLNRGNTQDNHRIIYIAYFNLANIAFEQENFEEAIKYNLSALKISKNFENPHYAISVLNQLGNTYYSIRNYDTSLDYYLKALDLAKETNFKDFELQLLANINNIRTRVNKVDKALKSYKDIIKKLETEEYKDILNYNGTYLSNLMGIGVCYYLLGRFDESIESYNTGIEFAKNVNSRRHIIIFNINIGEALIAKGNYSEALTYLTNSKSEILNNNEGDSNILIHTINLHLAHLHFYKQEYKIALKFLSESFDKLSNTKEEIQVEKIIEMYDLAERIAEKLGDKEKQLEYIRGYRRMMDSIYADNLTTKDKLYNTDISALEEKNQNLSSSKKRTIYLLLIVLALIIVLAFYQYKKSVRNKRLFLQLQKRFEDHQTDTEAAVKKEYVTDKKGISLLKKLNELEETEFYLDQNCNLYNTAKLIDTNTSYLSKIINEQLKKSFNDYINELRINYCIKRLKTDRKFRAYTIKGIGNEIGYKSVNTFTTAFKKQTGISHSYFINQVNTKQRTYSNL